MSMVENWVQKEQVPYEMPAAFHAKAIVCVYCELWLIELVGRCRVKIRRGSDVQVLKNAKQSMSHVIENDRVHIE